MKSYTSGRIVLWAVLMTLCWTGCSEYGVDPDDAIRASNDGTAVTTGARAGRPVTVSPGESIQAAVDAAEPGTTIRIRPGTYYEAVVVTKPNISLVGQKGPGGENPVIENPGGENFGILVNTGGDGVSIAHLTVKGFVRDGVRITNVTGFEVTHVVAIDNLRYGIYPIGASRGVVSHCVATGHNDAGIYVGRSSHVAVRHSRVSENVIGIEISNATFIDVAHNTAENNTVGILAALLPFNAGITIPADIVIAHNKVTNNNLPNFAPAGAFQMALPPGAGILVLGAKNSVVEKNHVTGHAFFGIAVASIGPFAPLFGGLHGLDPHPRGSQVSKNHVEGNGFGVSPMPPLPAVDLLWDTSGSGNCWDKNKADTSFPSPLPACE